MSKGSKEAGWWVRDAVGVCPMGQSAVLGGRIHWTYKAKLGRKLKGADAPERASANSEIMDGLCGCADFAPWVET
jgi:hypothetical protein